ncbi:MAG: 3-hydroxyacyl-ACP dehydratase [Chloroflexia bacterium]|nr:3-hydroxyacyl-ACP dehydratase [Chloroflexia bacterium]
MVNEFASVNKYIPQREPFIMISRLSGVSDNTASSALDITNENIFVKDGYFQEAGIIENIAQTAAAMTGYHAIANNNEVKRGYLGAIKNLKINNLPKVNSQIETSITIENTVMNVYYYIRESRCRKAILLQSAK